MVLDRGERSLFSRAEGAKIRGWEIRGWGDFEVVFDEPQQGSHEHLS